MALFKEFAAFPQVLAESPEQGEHGDLPLVRGDGLDKTEPGNHRTLTSMW